MAPQEVGVPCPIGKLCLRSIPLPPSGIDIIFSGDKDGGSLILGSRSGFLGFSTVSITTKVVEGVISIP